MNHELRFAVADIDIATTPAWSEDHFGAAAAARYEALIITVLDDISTDLRSASVRPLDQNLVTAPTRGTCAPAAIMCIPPETV